MNAQIRLSRITLAAALALAPAVTTIGSTAAHAQAAAGGTVTTMRDARPDGSRTLTFTAEMRHTDEDGPDNSTPGDDPTPADNGTGIMAVVGAAMIAGGTAVLSRSRVRTAREKARASVD